MANHKSALKRHRQSLKRRDLNRAVRGEARTTVKKTLTALQTGDKASATTLLKAAERSLARAAGKGRLHKKNASRRISRLAKQAASKLK